MCSELVSWAPLAKWIGFLNRRLWVGIAAGVTIIVYFCWYCCWCWLRCSTLWHHVDVLFGWQQRLLWVGCVNWVCERGRIFGQSLSLVIYEHEGLVEPTPQLNQFRDAELLEPRIERIQDVEWNLLTIIGVASEGGVNIGCLRLIAQRLHRGPSPTWCNVNDYINKGNCRMPIDTTC